VEGKNETGEKEGSRDKKRELGSRKQRKREWHARMKL